MSILRRAFASFKYRTGTEPLFDYANDSYIKYRQLFEARVLYGLTPPPRHLQQRILAGYFPRYFASGRQIAKEILSLVPGIPRRVLDFGCGSGRVTIAVSKLLDATISGTDIDPEAIEWCRKNITTADFEVNPHQPPTRYSSASFDLIYGVSVFTHLPEDMQHLWLAELQRICRGYLVLSVHGQRHYEHIPSEDLAGFLRRGFYYLRSGTVDGLPDFYQSTFHTHDYIRSEWSKYFKIVAIKERAIGWGNHDAVVCKIR